MAIHFNLNVYGGNVWMSEAQILGRIRVIENYYGLHCPRVTGLASLISLITYPIWALYTSLRFYFCFGSSEYAAEWMNAIRMQNGLHYNNDLIYLFNRAGVVLHRFHPDYRHSNLVVMHQMVQDELQADLFDFDHDDYPPYISINNGNVPTYYSFYEAEGRRLYRPVVGNIIPAPWQANVVCYNRPVNRGDRYVRIQSSMVPPRHAPVPFSRPSLHVGAHANASRMDGAANLARGLGGGSHDRASLRQPDAGACGQPARGLGGGSHDRASLRQPDAGAFGQPARGLGGGSHDRASFRQPDARAVGQPARGLGGGSQSRASQQLNLGGTSSRPSRLNGASSKLGGRPVGSRR